MSSAWDWRGVAVIPTPDKASSCDQITGTWWWLAVFRVTPANGGVTDASQEPLMIWCFASLRQFLLLEGFVRTAVWRIAQRWAEESWNKCDIFGLHKHTVFHFVVACGNGIDFAPCWISNLWPGVKQALSSSRQKEWAIFFSVAPVSFLM